MGAPRESLIQGALSRPGGRIRLLPTAAMVCAKLLAGHVPLLA